MPKFVKMILCCCKISTLNIDIHIDTSPVIYEVNIDKFIFLQQEHLNYLGVFIQPIVMKSKPEYLG